LGDFAKVLGDGMAPSVGLVKRLFVMKRGEVPLTAP
jgi:hypothetical protein